MSKSSLSSVVSDLVRASMGSSVSSTVTNEDLDRHVAELILKEAKQKAERYLQDGVQAYLPEQSENNLPRANKRFLSAIIRSTDDHNKAVLRAQAEAAQEVKAEREAAERNERRTRAGEAADAERLRRLMSGGARRDNDGSRSRRRDRDGKRRDRSWERRGSAYDRSEGSTSRHKRRRSRSKSIDRISERDSDRKRRRGYEFDEDAHSSQLPAPLRPPKEDTRSRSVDDESAELLSSKTSRTHPHRSHSRKRQRASSSEPKASQDIRIFHQRIHSPTLSEDIERRPAKSIRTARNHTDSPKHQHPTVNESESRELRPSRSRRQTPPSPTLSEEEDIERLLSKSVRVQRRRSASRSRSTSKPVAAASPSPTTSHPPSPKVHSSKMDKYFEPSYDPRLDVAPLSMPTIPSTGLINDAEFEGWDAMLEIIKQRRVDKVERKRLERLGLLPDSKDKEKKEKKEKKGDSEADSRWSMDSGGGIMDIEYKKRGSVREWDVGKEGF